jgi:beta-mannosidase
VTSTSLTSGWTLSALDGDPGGSLPAEIAATVPGCVHTDLLAAGLIDDPYRDDNENRLTWIGKTDWAYETTFHQRSDGAERVDLVCAGLDTVATLTLNGAPLGQTANMHRSYRFDLRPLLTDGPNTLRVVFHSAYDYANAQRERLGDRPGAYTEPYNFIRKMACNFGWDWGPTVVTAGIWQDISLHSWRTARLAQVRPLVTVDGETGHVRLHITLEHAGPALGSRSFGETAAIEDPVAAVSPKLDAHPMPGLTVTAQVAGVTVVVGVPAGEAAAVVDLDVPSVRRWWPRGYGEQPLYDVDVTLADDAGTELDRWQRRVGFRDVRLDTAPDAHGTPYTLVVNDVPVFVKGVNWIPDDAFVTRITRQRLAERLGQAVDAHINYLRIWGGGRYESEDFYSLADELGLLVGQDFLFACAAYPQEAPFDVEVEAEAREQVTRLASHPSLVTWTGNNENIWGHADWDWIGRLDGRTWGAGFYFDLLPRIVAELDPTRPYWPGSPWSGDLERHPNDPAHGTTHEWEVWNRVDYRHYRDYVPRFMAEFGFQAPPAYATLRAALSDQPLARDSPGMAHHQKAEDGDGKLQRGLDAHLPAPRDFDDWHYLTQLNQARAITLAVEHYRSHQPVCMGSIVWQLNDCWPVTSWAAVDAAGRRKPLWHALRRSYAPRLVSLVERAGSAALSLVNDTGRVWAGECVVTRHDLAGEMLAKELVQFTVPVRSAAVIELPDDVVAAGRPAAEVLRAEVDAAPPAWWFFAEDRDVEFPPAEFDAVADPFDGGCRVTVTARTVLRDLVLYPDRVDPSATVDQALVTLLPGESTTFTVHSTGPLDTEALLSRPVLRAVNDIPTR